MELRYDPVSDTTDYIETIRTTCPICGARREAFISVLRVPRDDVAEPARDTLDRLIADKFGLARERALQNPLPCETCSSQA